MPSVLKNQLKRLGEKISSKNLEVNTVTEEIKSNKSNHKEDDERSMLGKTSQQIISSTVENILLSEQMGLFETIALSKKDVFPTLLARLPIFMPISRSKQKKYLDKDNYLRFETPFGSGLRSGPLLTTRDEDTLMAMERLRSKQLHGSIENLPIKIPKSLYELDKNGHVYVDIVICTITMINEELEISDGGDNHNETLQSVRRLANTVIELTTNKKERYLSKCKEEGGQFKLVDVRWRLFDNDGLIFAQFSPVVTDWLTNEYTFMDWKTRKALGRNDTAKALMRFLSTQPRTYQRNMIELADCIGLKEEKRRIKPRMASAVKALIKVGWLKDYDFMGNGRTKPVVLMTERKDKNYKIQP